MTQPNGEHRSAHTDVVIVNFQSGSVLGDCLRSLAEADGIGRVVVVDNGSTDASAAIVDAAGPIGGHAVAWLPTGSNLGFGRAANRGVASTHTPFVVVLNPDTVVSPDAIVTMRAVAEADETVGVVGPTVLSDDGTVYPSARAFPDLLDAIGHAFVGLVTKNNPWSRRYLAPDRVDWVSGTAMLLRRDAFESIGGFDESYFMYVEDVDLCWRMGRAGYRVVQERSAHIRHRIGVSSEQAPVRMIVAHHRSLWRFERTTATGARRLALPLVAVGLALRAGLSVVRRTLRGGPPGAAAA